MELIKTISNKIDSFNLKTGHIFSWLALAMVILMFAGVVTRYFFNSSFIWQQELVRFMHAALFLSAAGYTLLNDEHVRVDVFYQSASEKNKAIINILGTILFLFPCCFAIAYFSTEYITSSWKILESSPEYGGIQGIFLMKSFIWFFVLVTSLQGISTILKSIITISDLRKV